MWSQGTADWASQNPILGLGQQVYDTSIKDFKVGDGITYYNSLPYENADFGISGVVAPTTGVANLNMGTVMVYTITLSGALTINAINAPIAALGATCYFLMTSAGSSNAITWGTNFKSTGTLSEGGTSGKKFLITFQCADGITWYEVARTTAM